MSTLWTPHSADAQTKGKLAPTPSKIDSMKMDDYKELIWQPSDNYFVSPGHIRITLLDADTHQRTVVIADDAQGSPTGDIVIHGRVRLERDTGVLTGRAMTYRVPSRTGIVLDAQGKLEQALLTGQKIEILENQDMKATRATFTTCINPKSHYHIAAREISVQGGSKIVARDVSFYIGSTKLISVPRISKNISKGEESPVPLPGYSKENFVQFRLRSDVISDPFTWLNYDLTVGLRRTPQLALSYETDLGHPNENAPSPRSRKWAISEPLRAAFESSPPLLKGVIPDDETKRTSFYSLANTGNFIYNRQRTDLQVTRLPEVGISFRNILDRQLPTENSQYKSVFGTGFFSPANWFVNSELGFGHFIERPTGQEHSRLGFRTNAVSPLFRIAGPAFVRYGGTMWHNLYTNGNRYTLLSPEVEADILLRPNTLIGVGYRYEKEIGSTPFLWDSLDVRHELRMRYNFLGKNWAYDTEIKYDMEHYRAYDSIFGIRRRLDCLEYGIQYRTRNASISLVLNLLPSGNSVGNSK